MATRTQTAQRLTALFALVVATLLTAAYPQAKAPPTKPARWAVAIDETLAHGHDSTLPPHISHLLGLSTGESSTPVKQFAKVEDVVRGFEVSIENHDDVVIFVDDRPKQESTFYLTSSRGGLRKVLSVLEGVGHDRAPTAADKKAFATEKQYWIEHLDPAPPTLKHP